MRNIILKSGFLTKNQPNHLNITNNSISSNYDDYNGNTYFHLLSSDEFHLICKYISDQETRINLMVLFYYGHKPSTYYRLINKPLRRISI